MTVLLLIVLFFAGVCAMFFFLLQHQEKKFAILHAEHQQILKLLHNMATESPHAPQTENKTQHLPNHLPNHLSDTLQSLSMDATPNNAQTYSDLELRFDPQENLPR